MYRIWLKNELKTQWLIFTLHELSQVRNLVANKSYIGLFVLTHLSMIILNLKTLLHLGTCLLVSLLIYFHLFFC